MSKRQPRKPRFEIFRAEDGQYVLRFVFSNGKKANTTETYRAKATAQRAAELIILGCQDEQPIEIRDLT